MTGSRHKSGSLAFAIYLLVGLSSCASYEPPKVRVYQFPRGEAFVEEPKRQFEKLGLVRTKIDFDSMQLDYDEDRLCQINYNKAVIDLVARAKEAGGDAVMGVRSVVMLMNGKMETYSTPECADDGQTGQILAQGIVVRWADLDQDKDPKAAARARRRRRKIIKELPPLEAMPIEEGEARQEAKEAARNAGPRIVRPGDPVDLKRR